MIIKMTTTREINKDDFDEWVHQLKYYGTMHWIDKEILTRDNRQEYTSIDETENGSTTATTLIEIFPSKHRS